MTKPWNDIASHNVTHQSGRVETVWDGHASMRQVWSGKPPGGAGRGWPCGRTIPLQPPNKRPIGHGSSRRPGPGRPGVCGDPAGAPHAGTGGSVLGAVRADRRVEPGRGHAAPGSGGPPSRAPGRCERSLLWGGRGARAPASAGAPAPGARQGHQGSTRGRAEHSERTGVCASPSTQGPRGDPVSGTWRERPAHVRRPPGTKLHLLAIIFTAQASSKNQEVMMT